MIVRTLCDFPTEKLIEIRESQIVIDNKKKMRSKVN